MRLFDYNNLRLIRLKRGLSQAELAAAVGVAQQHISRWENGKHLPTLEQFISIATALNCSLDELAGIERKPNSP